VATPTIVAPASFGAKADGTADDTEALQAALDSFSGKAITGAIVLPVGCYRITRPLRYLGQISYGVRIRGEVATSGLSGTQIRYDGPPLGGPVLEISGGMDCTIEHLAIDATKAQYGIWVHQDRDRGVGVSNLLLDRVTVGMGDRRDGSACLSLGVDPGGSPDTFQCDDIVVRGCKFVGGQYGIRTGVANVCNFFVENSNLALAQVGFAFGGSGVAVVRDSLFTYNTETDVFAGNGNLLVDGCMSEGSTMLLRSPGLTPNPAGATIRHCSWNGVGPADDAIISYQGALRLESNQFSNGRTDRSLPRVRLLLNPGGPATLDSSQNWFRRAAADYTDGNRKKTPLFVDGSGNDLTTRPDRGNWLRTFGDYGGDGGAIVAMRVTRITPPLGPQQPAGDLTVGGNLTVKGGVYASALDLGEGRYWSPDGFFLDPTHSWDRRRGWSGPPPRTK
jgi:hypothetical protein